MIEFAELLSVEAIDCQVEAATKKKALQRLSECLTKALPEDEGEDAEAEVSEMDILDALIGRERLGSTGLGKGVSLPHGRLSELTAPVAGLITLTEGVDFEAPDSETVDVLFGLLVPEESTDEHLQILAHMAKAFSDEELCAKIRACNSQDVDLLHDLLQNWSQTNSLSAEDSEIEKPEDH